MKRIFKGVVYILLLVLLFTYSACTSATGFSPVLFEVGFTGIPTIGFLFIFPAFVLAILSLCLRNKTVNFLTEMFSFFAAIFLAAAGVLRLCIKGIDGSWPTFILLAVSIALGVLTTLGLIAALKGEKKAE